jgi:hypothetical protein
MPHRLQTIRPHNERTGISIGEAIAVQRAAVRASTRAAIDKQIAAAEAADVGHGHRRERLDLVDRVPPVLLIVVESGAGSSFRLSPDLCFSSWSVSAIAGSSRILAVTGISSNTSDSAAQSLTSA